MPLTSFVTTSPPHKMSKRKGMSAEDKRKALLSMYHTSKTVYTLHEVEKEGPKTGVVRSAVMDVNQQLVDDGLVDTDKIGSTGYYWSFPSKRVQNVALQSSGLEEAIRDEAAGLADANAKVKIARQCRTESSDRDEQLKLLSSLKAEIAQLEGQVEVLKENDPEEVARQAAMVDMCKSAANRWTDNLHELQGWLVKKKGMSSKEAASTLKQMGVPENLELFE